MDHTYTHIHTHTHTHTHTYTYIYTHTQRYGAEKINASVPGSSFSVARRAPAIKLRNLTPATGGRRRAVVASGVLCCTAYPNIRLVVASRITGSGAHVDCPGVAWAAVGQSFRRLGAYRW